MSSDQDLDAIRQARLQELQSQSSSSGGGGEEGDEQQQREQAQRATLLAQILEPAAADRLGRIRLVKATRAHDVENRLIALARSGGLRARVTEAQLKDILGAVSEQQKEPERVKVQRRKGWDDEDDDLDDLLNGD